MRPIPCPSCASPRHLVGPLGGRQRQCFDCSHIFTPPASVEAAARWRPGPHRDLLEELVRRITQ